MGRGGDLWDGVGEWGCGCGQERGGGDVDEGVGCWWRGECGLAGRRAFINQDEDLLLASASVYSTLLQSFPVSLSLPLV